MGKKGITVDPDDAERESLTLSVDDRGRVTIPKAIRERLGIEPSSEVPARLVGSTLTLDPQPGSRLETATAGRDDWANTTPTDAGTSLFGPMDDELEE